MTTTAIAWTVAAVLWAAVLAVAGTATLNRLTRRRRHREPETPERPRTATAAAERTVPVRLVLRAIGAHRRHPAPRDKQVGEPHTGATEDFGPELRALRNAPVAPELVTAGEEELRWAQIWHDFERGFLAQVDDIFDAPLTALKEPLDAETCIRLDSAKWQTGEWSLAELRDRLAAEDLALAPNDLALTGLVM